MNTHQKPLWQATLSSVALLALLVRPSPLHAGPKDDVTAAMKKAYLATSYTCVSKIGDDPETHAKTEVRGYTSVTATLDGKPQTVVFKGLKFAVLTDAGWKSSDDVVAADPQSKLADWLGRLNNYPILEIGGTLDGVPTMTATGDGQYTGQLTQDAVETALNDFRPGTKVTNAHGTLTVTLKDGCITHCEVHLTGTVTHGDSSKAVDRKEIISLSDYNTTKPDVPDGARQILEK